MQSIVHILKLNDIRKGVSTKSGKPYELQDAECVLLADDGTVGSVGVLTLPRDLRELAPGLYTAHFAMRANPASRRIEAVVTGLTPVPPAASPATRPAAAKP